MPTNLRLAALSDYPFRRLNALIAECSPPQGLAPISLAVGEPQMQPPDLLHEALARHAHEWNRYPPAIGTLALRGAISGWLDRRFGLSPRVIDPDRAILPLPGTREGLFQAALALLPQERAGRPPLVMMANPFYQTYYAAAVMAGAEPVMLDPIDEATGLPDLDQIPEHLWARCGLFYLASPSNPQGAIAEIGYLRRLVALCRRHGAVLASDECYTELYYADPPVSALQAAFAEDGSLAGVIAFHSLSKRSSAPGLRSGFVAGDADLIAALTRLAEYGGAGLPLPVQAASSALWADDAHVAVFRAAYARNVDLAEAALGAIARPGGGFFLWLDVGDGERVARRLWAEAALRTLPGAYLARPRPDGSNPGARYLRLALVHEAPVMAEALSRLATVLGRRGAAA